MALLSMPCDKGPDALQPRLWKAFQKQLRTGLRFCLLHLRLELVVSPGSFLWSKKCPAPRLVSFVTESHSTHRSETRWEDTSCQSRREKSQEDLAADSYNVSSSARLRVRCANVAIQFGQVWYSCNHTASANTSDSKHPSKDAASNSAKRRCWQPAHYTADESTRSPRMDCAYT